MTLDRASLSRRDLLAGISATGASAAVVAPARAKAPMLNVPAPAYYRFKHGAMEATVVTDGPLALGEPKPEMFGGLTKEGIDRALTENFIRTDNVMLEQNALVLNTGDKLVLFDTGTGASAMFGDKSGRLVANLRAAGFDPGDFDTVVITHVHPDHCW